MLKRILIFILFNVCVFAYGQQLTRFAVVDLPKVYTAFFRDSRPVREFEERSARVQNEIDRRTREIQELRARHAEAVLEDNQAQVNRLESQIHRMSEALRDYYQAQTAILEDQRNRLMQSGSFLDQVYDEVRYIAESEGYSMVLSLSDNKGILWHSATVDITDKLIQNLLTKSGRN
ncbi:MAG: OmpH family outer membrane protein [Treponema sp.]|jgi:outer membrane protein|nr:OmpH family outer membrane protein [Treponema sp.]